MTALVYDDDDQSFSFTGSLLFNFHPEVPSAAWTLILGAPTLSRHYLGCNCLGIRGEILSLNY